MRVYRLAWRRVIFFAHNIVIASSSRSSFLSRGRADLSFLPALAPISSIAFGCHCVSASLATRYRDIRPALFSVVQLLFFMT